MNTDDKQCLADDAYVVFVWLCRCLTEKGVCGH